MIIKARHCPGFLGINSIGFKPMEIDISNLPNFIRNVEVVGINDEITALRFKGGVYKGVVFNYTQINLNVVSTATGEVVEPVDVDPDDETHQLRIGFEYVVFENPNNVNTDTKTFRDHLGHIVKTLIEKHLEVA